MEGYQSGSKNFNIPTPLRRTSRIHHVLSDENISIDPVTPHSMHTSHSLHKPVWCQLTFSSSDDDEDTFTVDNPLPPSTALLQNPMDSLQKPSSTCTLTTCDDLDDEEEEEDFQIVSLEDDHWTMEEIPDQPLCYTWTFSTAWTVSLPMPIFGLHIFTILQHLES